MFAFAQESKYLKIINKTSQRMAPEMTGFDFTTRGGLSHMKIYRTLFIRFKTSC